MSEIQCTFSGGLGITGGNEARQGKLLGKDSISARLRKPEGFKGAPLFADDRGTDPVLDAECQIRPDSDDLTGLTYNLAVTNFARCGVLRRNVSSDLDIWLHLDSNNIYFCIVSSVVILTNGNNCTPRFINSDEQLIISLDFF